MFGESPLQRTRPSLHRSNTHTAHLALTRTMKYAFCIYIFGVVLHLFLVDLNLILHLVLLLFVFFFVSLFSNFMSLSGHLRLFVSLCGHFMSYPGRYTSTFSCFMACGRFLFLCGH